MKEMANEFGQKFPRVVVAGAGIAGFTAAKTLASIGGAVDIVLVNGEDRLPYKRTKISKNMPFSRDAFSLETDDWYRSNRISLLSGRKVVELDIGQKRVSLDDGQTIRWDAALLTTGSVSAPLEVPGADRVPIHTVWTAADVEHLLDATKGARRILVVGGGVLGVEVCEQFSRMGKEVVFSVSARGVMGRQLNDYASRHLARFIESNGIEIAAGKRVSALEPGRPGETNAGEGITAILGNERVGVDAVVACTGVRPSVDLAVGAGIDVRRGITVNEYLETSAPGVFAAGDVAEHAQGFLSYLWHAAEYQGEIAARNAASYLGLGTQNPRSIFENPPFRLKCEVFGQYYFSAGVLPGVNTAHAAGITAARRIEEESAYRAVEQTGSGDRYRLLWYRANRLVGVIMVNDRDRAKTYQKAVREGWAPNSVEEELKWVQQ